VTIPKRSVKYTKADKNGRTKGDRTEGAAFCPVKLIDFNPNSRPQIINRLIKVYGWEPQEFTETWHAEGRRRSPA
jgi:hypothetical protein